MPRFHLLTCSSVALALVSQISLADAGFWDTPQQQILHGQSSKNESGSLFANLATTEQVDINGRRGQTHSFSLTNELKQNRRFMLDFANSGEQQNYVLGFQANDLTVSMLRGRGEDYSQIGAEYSSVDPYLFHAGYRQDFRVSGFAMDYSAGRFGHLQYGEAKVTSSGLLDRRARYFEWSNNRYFARASQFDRGGESIGNGLDFGVAFAGGKRVALQTMNLENDKRLQRIRFEFDGKSHRTYWLDFSAHQNPLFAGNDDYRVMFNFRTLLGANQLVSYQNDQVSDPSGEADPQTTKKKGGGWKRAVLIGGGVAAAAALSSSGSSSSDNLIRFRTQNEAARDVLNRINPESIRLNREHGGWVFLTPGSGFGSTTPVLGELASVTLPDPRLAVPSGSQVTATYHTHGGFDPRFDNENFSEQDLASDRAAGVDGYLGTPLGQFKYHNVRTGEIVTLGTIATE